ncbi:MAG: ABC transporter ATP-binding protein [Bacilli bacterium]|nr:ABC transporter ATP-binding protein [Bacilli bacterium]
MNLDKPNIIKNFFYSLKKIYKIDKIFVFETIIHTIISALVVFMYPYILKMAIEAIEQNLSFKELILKVLIVVVSVMILVFFNQACWRDQSYRARKLSALFTREYHLNSLKTDYEKFEQPESQDAFEKGSRALGTRSGFIGLYTNMFTTISKVITFIIGCGIILRVSIWLIVIIVLLAIIKLLLTSYNTKKEKTNFHDKTPGIWRKISYTNNISKNLTIGKDLRIYEMDKFIDMERQKTIDEYMKLYKKEEIRSNILGTIINLIHILDEVALYSFMLYEVINNNMSIADFTFIIASIRTLSRSLTVIINNFSNNLSYSLQVNDYRKFETLDLSFNGDTKPLVADEVEIEFKNVSYSYYMQEGYTLKNISFKIKKGERIALVGHNGAGKTTLIKLICGFYHPTEGEILINGVNINEIDRESLIKLIAPVFQDSNHYAVSIKENIAMETIGNIDDEKLYMSLNLAGLLQKIESLKNGVDTIITRDMDDTGVELSGGESQKLSIARAIYKNAPFVILDEPTSALDPIAESELYMNLNKIINNHSAIFISHRLSSTKFCDRIFFLEKGELLEVGTHNELMSIDSEYKKLFNMQAEYYKEVDE